MKNDAFLTKLMDLPEEDGSRDGHFNGQKVFKDSSDYSEDLREEAQDNVNTTALEWPLRHNNETEKIAFSLNGFRQAKKPRYTYAGRISRVPSRFLDSDSDSGDGSARKAVVSKLKVKRRRKLPSSSNKSLVNGFKEHNDEFTLKLTNIEPDRIIYNLDEAKRDSLPNLKCSEVFGEVSPLSDDAISDTVHEKEPRRFFQVNDTLNEALKDRESLLKVKLNGILNSNNDSVSGLGVKKASMCCLEAIRECVDVSLDNKEQVRFDSLKISTEQSFKEILCDKETANDFDKEGYLHVHATTNTTDTCNETLLNESCDSSTTNATFVSSIQNSKQRKVSCASLTGNDSEVSFLNRNDDKTCSETVVHLPPNGCLASEIVDEEQDIYRELDLVKQHDIASEGCIEKGESLPTKQLVGEGRCSNPRVEDESVFKPVGLNCFRNFKMRRAYAQKVNQKQLRRTERKNVNCSLIKKQGLIGQLKQKSLDKVKKAVKLQRKVNTKVDNKKGVQTMKSVKTLNSSQEFDSVLGMRRNPLGVYEFLVQWRNGTSCWVSSDQVVTNKHNCILRDYLVENDQDVSVINRIPFQAYCCDSLSLKECKPAAKTKKEKKKLLARACPSLGNITHEKKEVSVRNEGDLCYITLNRETCKRKLTCVRIITDLIATLEDASVSQCQLVVIRGLGRKVFGGLNLDTVSKVNADEKGNMVLSKARYLVQTLSHYPKPLVALISKPVEGIGAVFLSLFDMICNEDTWRNEQVSASWEESNKDTSLYCLPRVIGLSVPSEELLMGKKSEEIQQSLPASMSTLPESFFNTSCDSAVVNTMKESETAMHSLGKRVYSLGMQNEDVLKIAASQGSNYIQSTGSAAMDGSIIGLENEDNDFSSRDIPAQDTEVNCGQSTGSVSADRYMKELQNKILEERQLAEQYYEEISKIWTNSSTVLSYEEC